ncbi:MAG: transglutaminase-like domain-containing protein [Bacteroidia bacterium]
MLKEQELNALISLLDDPDESVYYEIQAKLLSLGHPVIPLLEHAWENSFDPVLQQRIEGIIHKIQFDNIEGQIQNWVRHDQDNLLKGILLVARYQYPDLDEKKVLRQIEQIKQDVWLELNNNLTALEKVRVLNHILFEVHGFSGNTSNYHAPQNSYLNNVLESKKGNPISLSILYLIIAQDLNIPIYGVNLPEHFVLAYVDEENFFQTYGEEGKGKVLFYINPFSKGAVFSSKEIDAFLKQLKLPLEENYYEPCENSEIIRRVFRNLILAYEKLGYPSKVKELENLLKVLNKG